MHAVLVTNKYIHVFGLHFWDSILRCTEETCLTDSINNKEIIASVAIGRVECQEEAYW